MLSRWVSLVIAILGFTAVLVVLTATAEASVVADMALWLDSKFSGKSCENLTETDFAQIESYSNTKSCDANSGQDSSRSVRSLNDLAENQFFNGLAVEELDQITCELTNVDRFTKDTGLVKLRAEEIAAKLPFITEQMKLADRAYADYQDRIQQNNIFDSYCRKSTGSARKECLSDLDKKRAGDSKAREAWQTHRSIAIANIASLWSGSTEAMREFYEKLGRREPLPTVDVIKQELIKQVPAVKAEIADHQNELLKQSTGQGRRRIFDKLSDKSKRQLVEASVASGLFEKAVEKKDDGMIKLLCRLEGKYTRGRDNLEKSATAATLLLGGTSALLSRIPIAVRAGKLSGVMAGVRSSSTVVGALAVGLDASMVADAIRRSCFSDRLKFSAKNRCPATDKEFKESELKKFEEENCVLNAAIGVAPAGVLAASVAYKSLAPTLKRFSLMTNEFDDLKIRSFIREEAAGLIEQQRKRLNKPPEISAEKFSRQQAEAEAYFRSNKIKVSEVKPELMVDELKMQSIDERMNGRNIRYDAVLSVFETRKKEALSRLEERRIDLRRLTTEIVAMRAKLGSLKINKIKREEELASLKAGADPKDARLRGAILDKESEILSLDSRVKGLESDIKIREKSRGDVNERLAREEVNVATAEFDIREANSNYKSDIHNLSVEREVAQTQLKEAMKFESSVDIMVEIAKRHKHNFTDAELAELAASKGSRKVYTLNEVPRSTVGARGKSPFWQHADFAKHYRELKEMGVEIILDPQKKDGAFFMPSKKAIWLSPDAPYHFFEHEFTHAQFSAYVSNKIGAGQMISAEFAEGKSLFEVIPAQAVKRIGKQNVKYLDGLLKQYTTAIAVDESLAVRKQLNAMGWKPVDPQYHWFKVYGGYFRVEDLLASRSAAVVDAKGKFTRAQEDLLDRELHDLGVSSLLLRGSIDLRNSLAKVRSDVRSGRIPAALATWRQVQPQLQKLAQDDSTYFYSEENGMIRLPKDGSRFEYVNLKPLSRIAPHP